jgi:hypothetical protein
MRMPITSTLLLSFFHELLGLQLIFQFADVLVLFNF